MATVTATILLQTLRPLLRQAQFAEFTGALHGRSDPEALTRDLCQRGWLTAFQGRQLLLGKGTGLVLGPYVLLDILGTGGAGHVFKARHRTMDRLVALKVLHPDLLADPEVVNRFFREIEVISQFDHPAIVHAYDAGVVGKTYYLAMEYVEGVDLERLVNEKGPLPAAQACACIRQAAEGLQYAHERGMVHRDIKPGKLLMAQAQGRPALGLSAVKILDLGLARLQEPVHGSRTRNLTVLAGNAMMQGTPDYMAPEQAIDFHNASTRADIYSLGCTFWFLLTGQPPFGGSTLAEKLVRHQQLEPPALEAVRKDLPPELPGIVRKMMAKRPDDRYRTPGEIAALLTAAFVRGGSESTTEIVNQRTPASGLLAVALPPPRSATRRPRRFVWLRARWWLPVVGAVMLAGLVLTVWLLLGTAERSKRPALAFTGGEAIALPNELFRRSPSLAVEAWFKTKDGGVIFGYQRGPYPTGGGSYVPALYVGKDGLLRGEFWFGATKPITSKAPVNDDVWHHACLTADGTTKAQSLFLDGTLIATQPGALVPLDMADHQVGIGLTPGWPGGNDKWFGFTGTLAEVRVWHRPLTIADIQDYHGRSLTGHEPGLVVYFPMDETSGAALVDRVPGAPKVLLGGPIAGPKPTRTPGGPPVK